MRQYIKPIVIPVLTGLALSLTGCADASSEEQTIAPIVVSEATHWAIQSDASHIHFTAQQEGKSFTGEFKTFSGTIQFDPEAPETGLVDISIPLSGIEAGSNDRNSTLPSKVWFSAKAFPVARFTSHKITKQGEGYLAKGELTLKGKTLPIDLPFDLQVDGVGAIMTGRVDIDRTLWKVGDAPWDTDEWVSRTVEISIKVTANRID